ncbi:MAG: 6-phosphogluconolactonase [Rhodobacteraceae bacterium]|nr:6-phosphogluconolactonase [Paracoccaceae bacterium]
MANWAEYKDTAAQAMALAAIVTGQLANALATHGKATLAVPGGTTPGAFLKALSRAEIDWANVNVLLTDERFVPESSERSNTRLLRETLLQGPAAAATLVPLYENAPRPEDVLDNLSRGIRQVLPLDICVLGMGADMHTASLFPGADRLTEALDPECSDVLLPMRANGAPEPRLTLTAPVLTTAKHLHLLITGPEKLAALKLAERPGLVYEAPVRAILTAPASVTVHYTEGTKPA